MGGDGRRGGAGDVWCVASYVDGVRFRVQCIYLEVLEGELSGSSVWWVRRNDFVSMM